MGNEHRPNTVAVTAAAAAAAPATLAVFDLLGIIISVL